MKNKKGFEMQFNWVFVLVVGASILVFFTAVTIKQKNVSEASASATVLKSMQAMISSASASAGTTKIVKIPNSRIEVGCNKISVGSSSKQYTNLVLFAPNLVKGDNLITKTLPFSTPYKVTNILYVTSPNVRYVLFGNSDLFRKVEMSLPLGLKKESYGSFTPLRAEGNYKVRFIFFDEFVSSDVDLGLFDGMSDEDVTGLSISGDMEKGNLNFYRKKGASFELEGSSYYIGLGSLIGAVYSDKLENYECNMRNVFSRLNIVTGIYIDRSSELADYYIINGPIECGRIYQSLGESGLLSSIKISSSEFSYSNILNIIGAATMLSNKNEKAQLESCSLIY